MDANKRIKLQEIGYVLHKSCEMCQHGRFYQNTAFGDCQRHSYEHLNSDNPRKLSVHRSGVCENFANGSTDIGGFTEFVE